MTDAVIVLGTRPEVMKNWSVVRAYRERGAEVAVLHTGQHHSAEMHADVFAGLGYEPDLQLEGDYRFGRAVDWVMDVVVDRRPDVVVVNGDTAAALVGAVAALYTDTPLAHVEAGLRSGDHEMREERNRIMVDATAAHLFAYTAHHADQLRRRPDLRGAVHHVGNTTVDLLDALDGRLPRPFAEPFAYVTLHRKELTDRPQRLLAVLDEVASLRDHLSRIVLPMHPRTADALRRAGRDPRRVDGIEVVAPLPPIDSLACISHASVVITDSGCIQEEAYLLATPCVTARDSTERPETLVGGANVLTGFTSGAVRQAALCQLVRRPERDLSVYGEPGVGDRIVDVLTGRH